MNNLKIENNYHDAMFFASATINKHNDFYITDGEFRLLTKLIHYAKTDPSITWSSENISKHIFTTDDGIDKVIQRLKRKGYINTVTKNIDRTNKKRTITINWEKFEALNKLIEAYQGVEPKKESEPTPPAAPEPMQERPSVPTQHVAPVPTPEPVQPAKTIETINTPPVDEDKKKAVMRERFESKFYFKGKDGKKGRNITPAEFHQLTDDKFRTDIQNFGSVYPYIKELKDDDFETFWLTLQQMKKELKGLPWQTQIA